MSKISIDKKKKYITGGVTAVAISVAACGAGMVAEKKQEVLNDTLYGANMSEAAVNVENIATGTDAVSDTVSEEELIDKLSANVNVEEKDIYKDETVYAFADASGKPKEILVNEVLKNTDGKAVLTDKTDLKDIENIKGDETFAQDGDTITWQAAGNDITYQGRSDKELPVNVSLSYYLDGSKVTPEQLAGASGRVKIRIDYTNNAAVTKEINGHKEDVYVPFIAVTGMVLPENFTNVTVTNGKCMAQGESNIVVGFGMPGLKDSIKSDGSDFSEELNIPDYVEVEADVVDFALDMTATVVLDGSAMNIAGELDMSALDDVVASLSDATAQLVDGSGQLSEGTATLLEKMSEFNLGVGTLKSGIDSLSEKSDTLITGLGTIDASAQSISNAIAYLDASLNTAMTEEAKKAAYDQAYAQASAAAVGTIDAQAETIANNAAETVKTTFTAEGGTYDTIKSSVDTTIASMLANEQTQAAIASDVQSAVAGAVSSSDKTAVIVGALTQTYMQAGMDQQTAYAQALSDVQALAAAAGNAAASTTVADVQSSIMAADMGTVVATTCEQVAIETAKQTAVAVAKQTAETAAGQAAGAAAIQGVESAKSQIATQIEAVQANGYSLVTGSAALAQGTGNVQSALPLLKEGIAALKSGASTLTNGSTLLVDGVSTLNDGATTLKDGMAAYDTEAISKIINSYNGDVKSLVDRLSAVATASTEYDTFTMHEEGVAATTKFIIKTEEIKAE